MENIERERNINLLLVGQSGVYQLETKLKSGCSYLSEPFRVDFNTLQVKINKPDLNCANNLGTLSSSLSTYGGYYDKYEKYIIKPISYQWQLNGQTIGDKSSQAIEEAGIYSLTVKQGTCTATASTKVDIIDIPKTLTPNADSAFFCPTGSVMLEAPKADKYTWLRNNVSFNENQTQAIKASNAGSYRVWLETKSCARMSKSINVSEKTILPTASLKGNSEISMGDSAKLVVDLTSAAPWTLKLSNNQTFIANKTPFTIGVKPTESTNYSLQSVSNLCGNGTVNGEALVKIIILGTETIEDASISLSPIPTQSICELKIETFAPQNIDYQLFSIIGKELEKFESKEKTSNFYQKINLENLPSGTYLLKINIGNKMITKKIIKF